MDFNLIIRTTTKDYLVSVNSCSTVRDLKSIVKTSAEIDESRQRLIYRGRVLQDETQLGEYHIEDQHVVHLVVRPEASPISPEAVPTPIEPPPSLEHLRQGLLSIRTILSSIDGRSNTATAVASGEISVCRS